MEKYGEFFELQRIVDKYVKQYKDDFYKYDLNELSSKDRKKHIYGLYGIAEQI